MDMDKIIRLRYIFDQIKIHPAWNKDNRAKMSELFGLEEEDLDVLHEFMMWVQNHELEYAFESYKK